jgi:hypothetical protein
MPTSSVARSRNWGHLAQEAHMAANDLRDPAEWARMVAIEETCKRIAELTEARQRARSWSRISRISGCCW